MRKYYLFIFLIATFLLSEGCSSPKEGCGMDPSVDYEKVVSRKHSRKKKNKKYELFGKDRRKRMEKKRGN